MQNLPRQARRWISRSGPSTSSILQSPRNWCIDYCRWFAYDTICQLSFGEPLGFVKEGRDIGDLIGNFHDMAPFAAVVGALPWLARPFLENPLTRRFAMPKPGDGSGTGNIMAVRLVPHLVKCFLVRTLSHRSFETSFSNSDSKIPKLIKEVTFSITYSPPRMPMVLQSRSMK